MAAAGSSRISPLRATPFARRAEAPILVTPLGPAHQWPVRTSPAQWRCCGALFQVCGTKLTLVEQPWTMPLILFLTPHVAPPVRLTTCMVGDASTLQRLWECRPQPPHPVLPHHRPLHLLRALHRQRQLRRQQLQQQRLRPRRPLLPRLLRLGLRQHHDRVRPRILGPDFHSLSSVRETSRRMADQK